MKLVWDQRVGEWVSLRLFGRDNAFERYQSLGVADESGLIAGVVFHNWEPQAEIIEVSAFAKTPRWFSRSVLSEMFSYTFGQLGCQMTFTRQAVSNQSASKIFKAVGGTEYVIPRLFGRHTDGSVVTLTEEAWRASKFNREAQQ